MRRDNHVRVSERFRHWFEGKIFMLVKPRAEMINTEFICEYVDVSP